MTRFVQLSKPVRDLETALSPCWPSHSTTRTSIQILVATSSTALIRLILKDSWRDVAGGVKSEGEVYQMLHQGNVKNIPLCMDFCDVGGVRYHQTQTRLFSKAVWLPGGLRLSISVLRHHPLILDTVGKNLDEFSSSRQMVRAVCAALVGMSLTLVISFLDADTTSIAHKGAYLLGVLHRDISPANILITDDNDNRITYRLGPM
jgi:hypothetical protein